MGLHCVALQRQKSVPHRHAGMDLYCVAPQRQNNVIYGHTDKGLYGVHRKVKKRSPRTDRLTARMKKSSCIQETAPKFEYLNTLSMTHITRSAKHGLKKNHIFTYVSRYWDAHTYTYICIHIWVCLYVHTHIYIYGCVCMYIHIYTYMGVFVCT
jgi:hypothetical protein